MGIDSQCLHCLNGAIFRNIPRDSRGRTQKDEFAVVLLRE